MAFVIEYPQVNGHRFSHESLEISWNGIALIGVDALDFDDELAPGELYGTAPQIIGRTRGKGKASASISMARLEWERVRRTLGVGGQGFGENASNIRITYFEIATEPLVDQIVGVRVSKVSQGSKPGGEALMVKLDLHPMRIQWNGDMIAAAKSIGGIVLV